MNAQTLATFCAVQELDYIEQGISHGVRGAWFQTRKRERKFYANDEVQKFTDKVKASSDRHTKVQPSYTS